MVAPAPQRRANTDVPLWNFYRLFWIFFLGCFFGVVVETLWFLITTGQFFRRSGLIYGPFNPIYGFGAVIMTIALNWLRHKDSFWILLGGGVIGSAYEYFCSWIQEVVFGTVSWEYSDMPLNLNGRINLFASVCWGVLALLWLKALHPFLCHIIDMIPARFYKVLAWLLLAFMLYDMGISILAVGRQSARRMNIPAETALATYLDEHYPDEFLSEKYPSMIVVDRDGEAE